MRNYAPLGPTPCDEPCAQVGTHGYRERALRECNLYAELIRTALGPEPEGAKLAAKSFSHDFGQYYEVVCWFDDAFPESIDYAFRCESDAPTTWENIT